MTQPSKPKPTSIRCSNCGHDNLTTAKNCIVCDAPLTYTSRFQRKQKMPTGLLPSEEDHNPTTPQDDLHRLEQQLHAQLATRKINPSPARKTGTKCPDCGFVNRVGDLFCLECGANITNAATKTDSPADVTQQMKALNINDIQAEIEHQQMMSQSTVDPSLSAQSPSIAKPSLKSLDDENLADGCFQFTEEMLLRFTNVQTGRYTEVIPNKDKPMLIGRSHDSLPIQPDVDLTPFLTEQHGVSRRHALMRLRDLRLELQDLNSTNGTGINGFRFRPKETHQIRSGDVITLGRVSMKVSFLRRDTPRGGNVTDKLE